MLPTPQGSFRLFRVAGINVYLHWTWLIAAYIVFRFRTSEYASPVWNVAEYLGLFGIVLLHEFGHALACRQVGGRADQIVLWPLGGVAYVQPPPRPGAVLWSIAAGPLVNLLLVPVLLVMLWLCPGTPLLAEGPDQLPMKAPDAWRFLAMLNLINGFLFVFNMLPIYPLDGGQIVHALLWFVVGRARSLKIVSIVGLVVGGCLVIPLLLWQDFWGALIAVFVALRCWNGFQQARLLSELEKIPRHRELACPACGAAPFAGDLWECPTCHATSDLFVHQGVCPTCGTRITGEVLCPDCHQSFPPTAWVPPVVPAEKDGMR
jgi:Zn-dependent protease